jgi:peptidyl-tRNA hydrolase, PTH1 family
VEYQLVVGLGNPGVQYKDTRHNAGFLVVDLFRRRHRASAWKTSPDYQLSRLLRQKHSVELLKPMKFMNLSGEVVWRFLSGHGIRPSETIVIHDDMDIGLGRIKIKRGGGSGGHKGINSIIAASASTDFTRVRIGIGRAVDAVSQIDHVLSAPKETIDKDLFEKSLTLGALAVETLIFHGAEYAMNRYNQIAPIERNMGADDNSDFVSDTDGM